MAEDPQTNAETEHPLGQEDQSIRSLIADENHDPGQLQEAIDDLLAKLDEGDILKTINIQEGYVAQTRDLLTQLIQHEAVDYRTMDLVAAREELKNRSGPTEGTFEMEEDEDAVADESGQAEEAQPEKEKTGIFTKAGRFFNSILEEPTEEDYEEADRARSEKAEREAEGEEGSSVKTEKGEAVVVKSGTSRQCFNLVKGYMRSGADAKFQTIIGDAIAKHLYEEAEGEVTEETLDDYREGLQQFLSKRIYGEEAVAGAKAFGTLADDVRKESKEKTADRKDEIDKEIKAEAKKRKKYEREIAKLGRGRGADDSEVRKKQHELKQEIENFQSEVESCKSDIKEQTDLLDALPKKPKKGDREMVDARRQAIMEKRDTFIQERKAAQKELAALKKDLATTGFGQEEGVADKIAALEAQIDASEDKTEQLQDQLKVVEQAGETKEVSHVKVTPEVLLSYIHQYFLTKPKQGEKGEIRDVDLQDALPEAQRLTMENVEEYDLEHSKAGEATFLRRLIRGGIKTNFVVDHLATKTVLRLMPKDTPDDDKEKIIKAFKELRDLNPKKAGPEKFTAWINKLESALPEDLEDEKREQVLQKMITNSIAAIENSVGSVKWYQRGLQPGHFKKLTMLKNRMRQGYESRIAETVENEGLNPGATIKKTMEEIGKFGQSIRQARKLKETNLPEELRKEFAESAWGNAVVNFMGGAGKKTAKGVFWIAPKFLLGSVLLGGGKIAAPHVLKGSKKLLSGARKFVNKHPEISMATAYGTLFASLTTGGLALTALPVGFCTYACLRGLVWGAGKGIGVARVRFAH